MDEPEPPKKIKKVTRKQAAIARARVKYPEATQKEIAFRVGTSRENVNQVLAQPHVKARIREIMNNHKDTSLEGLHKRMVEGLNAKSIQFFQKDGVVTDKRTTIDHTTRHKHLETALELHGAREKDQAGSITNNFFTKEAIEAFVEAFKRKLPLSNGHDPRHT